MTGPATSLGVRAVLRIADYRRVWAAQAISDLGDGLTNLTLFLVVLRLTGSTAAIALMAIALAVPTIVVGPIAGVFVDRWDRRRIMLASDLLRAAIVLGFILVGSADRLPLLYLLAIAHATVGTFFGPARMALVPRIVPAPGLMTANSLAQMTRVIAGVVGSSLAGVIAGVAAVTWPAFVADAATFVASFILVLGVRTSARPEAASAGQPEAGDSATGLRRLRASLRGLRASLAEGLVLVLRSPVLLGTMLGAGVTMLGLGAVNVLFVPLFVRELALPVTWLGVVDIAQTVGMVLAAGLTATIAARVRPTRIVVVGLAGLGLFVGLIAGAAEIWQLALLVFVVGWFVTPLEAALATIIQTEADDARRGRVASTLHAVMGAASVLSMALAGVFGDVVGVRNAFVFAGIVVGSAAVVAAIAFRATPAPVPVPEAAVAAGPSA